VACVCVCVCVLCSQTLS